MPTSRHRPPLGSTLEQPQSDLFRLEPRDLLQGSAAFGVVDLDALVEVDIHLPRGQRVKGEGVNSATVRLLVLLVARYMRGESINHNNKCL